MSKPRIPKLCNVYLYNVVYEALAYKCLSGKSFNDPVKKSIKTTIPNKNIEK